MVLSCQSRYLVGILYNSDLLVGQQKNQKNREGDVRSVIPFLMTKNNTALNIGFALQSLRSFGLTATLPNPNPEKPNHPPRPRFAKPKDVNCKRGTE